MDYKVTCSNCGQQYKLSAEGGQTVWARCPNCGHTMRVNLPAVDGNSSTNEFHETSTGYSTPVSGNGEVNNGKKNGSNHVTNILLALILGILVGGIAWFVWQQKQKNDEQARIELKEARKAHQDSLMALRNQQLAEEQAAQKAEEDKEAVSSFLNQFYDTWFSNGDMSQFTNNLSEQCYNRLSSENFGEEEDDDDTEIDWSMLCPSIGTNNHNTGNANPPSSIKLNITHMDGNWYRIRFTSNGVSEYREIEAIPQNGQVIINDFR